MEEDENNIPHLRGANWLEYKNVLGTGLTPLDHSNDPRLLGVNNHIYPIWRFDPDRGDCRTCLWTDSHLCERGCDSLIECRHTNKSRLRPHC